MRPHESRSFYALVSVLGYKLRFETNDLQCIGGISSAREIVQDMFDTLFDQRDYPRIPDNHVPARMDIAIRWVL